MAPILALCRDPALVGTLAAHLEETGRAVAFVESAAALTPALDRAGPAVLIVDLAHGQDALKAVRSSAGRANRVSVIAIADARRPESSAEALRLGALDILPRGHRKPDLLVAVANACEFHGVSFRLSDLEALEADHGFFASSPAMRALRDLVGQVALSRCGVLLVGERGTGKEMVARAIHRLSTSAARSFTTIDCAYRGESPESDRAAVADFEREIFDAVARPALDLSLTGPEDRHDTDGVGSGVSTVFLKRVDLMAPVVQGTLERLLAEGESRLGDARPLPVRIVASARPDIADGVNRGLFRRGLFERLSVVRLDLPPLRRRPQDVPLLATHFLKEACERHGAPAKVLSPAAQTLLAALPWRGNARELQHLTERLAVLVIRGVVLQEDVLQHVFLESTAPRGVPRGTLRQARERFEREFIAGVVQRHRGRMGAAAKELGIERTNLYRKIKQLGVRWE